MWFIFVILSVAAALWLYARLTCGQCVCPRDRVSGKTIVITGGNRGKRPIFEISPDGVVRSLHQLLVSEAFGPVSADGPSENVKLELLGRLRAT